MNLKMICLVLPAAADLWGEAVRHAAYILNRVTTKALTSCTPYEAWSGIKPNVDHVKVFGCLAHMRISNPYPKKLDDRSQAVIHLGIETGTKAYRLYDPISEKLYISRDVKFEENTSWCWSRGERVQAEQGATFNIYSSYNLDPMLPTDPLSPSGSLSMPMNDQYDSPSTFDSSPQHSTVQETESSNSIGSPNPHTPDPHTPVSVSTEQGSSSGSNTSGSSSSDQGPQGYRTLSDTYARANIVKLDAEDALMFLNEEDPTKYSEAVKKAEWRQAMEVEWNSIVKNRTWKLTDLPQGQKSIGLRWVFKLKRDADGKPVKHKARLVAKGYVQKQGIDFEEAFAPVARMETIRLLLALSASRGWEVHHLDVKSAFLNGELEEEVYVNQPEGFVKKDQPLKVYRLYKALYGLRQAPRAWNIRLDKCLRGLGFSRCPQEHAVYSRNTGAEVLIVGIYVDDMIVTGSSVDGIKRFKVQMQHQFEMSDLGSLSYYLGIEVIQKNGNITLSQSTYAKNLLEKVGKQECNPVRIPMEPKLQFNENDEVEKVNPTEYKSIIGSLRYLLHTRPDLAYAVGIVSRHMEGPTTQHLQAVKHILRYVRGTVNHGLCYSKGNMTQEMLFGYTDSNLAGDPVDRKSTSGMAIYLNNSLISWSSHKQKSVALSSCEAEFIAATVEAVILYVDNKSAISLMKNPVFHERSKHIDTRFHFIRDQVEKGEIVVKHVPTEKQRADILTKGLAKIKFSEMKELLGVKDVKV
ncbi:hypothetical protein E3N88_15182 [Mikania micrantha]|uniref:Uncharacterized protein n=1 Tax=Mikania micrantha TaxID=192012 RepID=A0A5N6NVC5_9ASTR|nr:hypothetical protein E3N88_15182 [Mikania micrantha]